MVLTCAERSQVRRSWDDLCFLIFKRILSKHAEEARMRRRARVTLVTNCGRWKKKKGPRLLTIPAHGINSQVTSSVNFWKHPTAMMCICYSVHIHLYKLYLSECLSSCTLRKSLLFTGEGRLPVYMGIFCKQLFFANQIQKRLLYCQWTYKKTQVFFSSHMSGVFCWIASGLPLTQVHISWRSWENVTQNTTRFKLCSTTSHTCPDKRKRSFWRRTRSTHKMSLMAFFFIVRLSSTCFCVALLLLLLVVGKPVPAVSYLFVRIFFFLRILTVVVSVHQHVNFPLFI